MTINLKLVLLLFGVSVMTLTGCKKHNDNSITITGTQFSESKPGILIGTFTANGAFNSSGDAVMVVEPRGTDSIHCTYTMTAPEGTFVLSLDCEMPPKMNGAWKVIDGNGAYFGLQGKGPLTMMFPPDVPTGALSQEILTGVVWWHLR